MEDSLVYIVHVVQFQFAAFQFLLLPLQLKLLLDELDFQVFDQFDILLSGLSHLEKFQYLVAPFLPQSLLLLKGARYSLVGYLYFLILVFPLLIQTFQVLFPLLLVSLQFLLILLTCRFHGAYLTLLKFANYTALLVIYLRQTLNLLLQTPSLLIQLKYSLLQSFEIVPVLYLPPQQYIFGLSVLLLLAILNAHNGVYFNLLISDHFILELLNFSLFQLLNFLNSAIPTLLQFQNVFLVLFSASCQLFSQFSNFLLQLLNFVFISTLYLLDLLIHFVTDPGFPSIVNLSGGLLVLFLQLSVLLNPVLVLL